MQDFDAVVAVDGLCNDMTVSCFGLGGLDLSYVYADLPLAYAQDAPCGWTSTYLDNEGPFQLRASVSHFLFSSLPSSSRHPRRFRVYLGTALCRFLLWS
jgi:hypothetical protein